MKFPSGIVASCNTTYGADMEGFYRVHGSKGWLEVDSAFVYEGLRLRADYAGAQLDELNPGATPRTSRPKPTTSPTASKMGWSRNRRSTPVADAKQVAEDKLCGEEESEATKALWVKYPNHRALDMSTTSLDDLIKQAHTVMNEDNDDKCAATGYLCK